MVERFTHTEMAHELARLASGKRDWLSRFSGGKNKRPDHEIDGKRRELSVLQQASTDYQKAAERAAA